MTADEGTGSHTSPSAPSAVVVVASNRAAAGVYEDACGPLIAAALAQWGYRVGEPIVVGDGDPVGRALAGAVADRVAVVLTTGGTGLTPTDRTPEQTRAVIVAEVPGIAEAIRAAGIAKGVPTAVLSRGLAGLAGPDRGTLVVNLPGSRGGVRDALAVLAPILRHATDQIGGGDH